MIEETCDIVEVVIDNNIAPVDKTPSCTREQLLRAPDWRYQTAIQYLQEEKAGRAATIPSDIVVQFAIRVLRAHKHPENRCYVDSLWPDISEVIRLGTTARHTAIVAEIEACLIAGRTVRDIIEEDFYVKPIVYELYSKLFFDLSGIIAIHSWFNDFLFSPEKYQSNTTLLRARLLAYYGGAKAGSSSAVLGMTTPETEGLLKKISSSERQKKVFDYLTKAVNMDNETYVAIMEAAVKSMSDRDFQEKMRDRDDAGSGSLEELAEGLEQGIKAFSQTDIANSSKLGLDFDNQYTTVILRKDQDNGN
jgi:hypothetical protein